MKSFWVFIICLGVVAFAAIMSKPSNQQCVELAKSSVNTAIYNSSSNPVVKGIESIFVDVTPEIVFRVEDNTFFKTVYLKLDNTEVGIVLFGTFINTGNSSQVANSAGNSQNKFQEKREQAVPVTNDNGYQNNDNNAPVSSERTATTEDIRRKNLETLKARLYTAQDKMRRIKQFHFLRSDQERQQQIEQEELYIQELENKIRSIESPFSN